jgi:hypothetical protein
MPLMLFLPPPLLQRPVPSMARTLHGDTARFEGAYFSQFKVRAGEISVSMGTCKQLPDTGPCPPDDGFADEGQYS